LHASPPASAGAVANRHSVATAESCTGGWIAKALTDIAGSSQWFAEGFVTYSNESKVRQARVSRSVLRSDGAVSEAAVRAMAAGALRRHGAQRAVGGDRHRRPGGRCPASRFGTVWLGWAERRGRAVRMPYNSNPSRLTRKTVRRKTCGRRSEGLLGM